MYGERVGIIQIAKANLVDDPFIKNYRLNTEYIDIFFDKKYFFIN